MKILVLNLNLSVVIIFLLKWELINLKFLLFIFLLFFLYFYFEEMKEVKEKERKTIRL